MGIVHLAKDQVLELPVAIKVVPEDVRRDTEGIADLKKEVLRGMALTHKGIVRVFSFEQDTSMAAIVMEFVEGQTLADLKAAKPHRCFNPNEIEPWLEQLCEVLDYAHTEARIAHRDLKPRNIIVKPDGRVKVADFGIASIITETQARVSVRQNARGTPPYMSPQQASGEAPTALDDIYSLGATLYELLTSKPPFFQGNLIAQVLHEIPPDMNERRRELGIKGLPDIPETWEQTVAACIAKDPKRRPQSGEEVLQRISEDPAARAVAVSESAAVEAPDTPEIEVRYIYRAPTFGRRALSAMAAGTARLAGTVILAALSAGAVHFIRHLPSRSAASSKTAAEVVVPPWITEERSSQPTPAPRNEPRSDALRSGRLDDPPRPAGRRPPTAPNLPPPR
jgi:serine/threonine protein kinase